MKCQGWGLRRMISIYNDVVRRPHLPRDRALVRIMSALGIDTTAATSGPDGNPDSEGNLEEEEGEEDLPTDDELVELEGRCSTNFYSCIHPFL